MSHLHLITSKFLHKASIATAERTWHVHSSSRRRKLIRCNLSYTHKPRQVNTSSWAISRVFAWRSLRLQKQTKEV